MRREDIFYETFMRDLERLNKLNRIDRMKKIDTIKREERKPHNPIALTKVIYNPPAVIAFWDDGTKTKAICDKEDSYDEEKGLYIAVLKKLIGNKTFFDMCEAYLWNIDEDEIKYNKCNKSKKKKERK